LPLVYCPADDTLFEVSPEIRCSGVSSRYCCYGNHPAVISQFKNTDFKGTPLLDVNMSETVQDRDTVTMEY